MVLLLPISRVAPSGEAPATKLAAISPAAPGLFTTIVGVALAVERNSAMARAPMSTAPPAACGGDAPGRVWARAGATASAATPAAHGRAGIGLQGSCDLHVGILGGAAANGIRLT